jgi:hypothetical protein
MDFFEIYFGSSLEEMLEEIDTWYTITEEK